GQVTVGERDVAARQARVDLLTERGGRVGEVGERLDRHVPVLRAVVAVPDEALPVLRLGRLDDAGRQPARLRDVDGVHAGLVGHGPSLARARGGPAAREGASDRYRCTVRCMTDVRSRTHAQAVDAAIELFTRKGYEQTTVEEIADAAQVRSEEHTSELQSRENLVCRLLLEKKKKNGTAE